MKRKIGSCKRPNQNANFIKIPQKTNERHKDEEELAFDNFVWDKRKRRD